MGFGIGRGGPLTVLLGLFIYAVIGCGYVLFWGLVLTCLIIRQTYRGARWLYRRHKANSEIPGPHAQAKELPAPYMSPVEYRDNDRS